MICKSNRITTSSSYSRSRSNSNINKSKGNCSSRSSSDSCRMCCNISNSSHSMISSNHCSSVGRISSGSRKKSGRSTLIG